jgi:hypothetical protein
MHGVGTGAKIFTINFILDLSWKEFYCQNFNRGYWNDESEMDLCAVSFAFFRNHSVFFPIDAAACHHSIPPKYRRLIS